MKTIYLSATGNSLYVAKRIGGDLYSIPDILKRHRYETFKDECIGLVFPCYYLGVPRLVHDLLKSVRLACDYCFAVITYGNYAGDACGQFLRLAKKYGLEMNYVQKVCMVDNYLRLFDMTAQIANVPAKNIEGNLDGIVSAVRSRSRYLPHSSPVEALISAGARHYYRMSIRKADNRYSVDPSCNLCRICEKVCPVDNIEVTDRPRFLHQCEECLACVHHCPQNAIRLRGEKSSARFVNEHVRTSEIIAANS